ncbi:MAG: glycosyltransferase family 4 protein [Methyloligellaceae bacterium]
MSDSLSIIHCLRAPVGGLFRHVCDLADEQTGMGHSVGVICDARSTSPESEAALRNLESICALGVVRAAMSRQLGLRDLTACKTVRRFARNMDAQVLHGHGAKGGAYARLAAHMLKRREQNIRSFYTPQGGSRHYSPSSLKGRIFMALEKRLAAKTDGLIFESKYSAGLYEANVGAPSCEARIIPNGLKPREFYEVVLDERADDFVFVGELRHLKGVDVMLQALGEMRKTRPVTAYIAGGGPDDADLRKLARKLNLSGAVTFAGPVPAGAAFTRGRCLVVPSRAESFPYIILEAAAAQLPIIATNVGGISEIIEGTQVVLVPADDAPALIQQMSDFLENPQTYVEKALALQKSVATRFTVKAMAQAVTDFYESC